MIWGVLLCGAAVQAAEPTAIEQADWSLDWRATLPLEEAIQAVHPIQKGKDVWLLIGENTLTRVLHPQTAVNSQTIPLGALSITTPPSTEPNTSSALLCGPEGIHRLAFSAENAAQTTTVVSSACRAITSASDTAIVVAAHNDNWTIYDTSNDGGWTRIESLNLPSDATPLVARRPGAIAIAHVGGQEIVEHSSRGVMRVPAGGALIDLAASPGGWAWTVDESDQLYQLTHPPISTGLEQAQLLSAHLDQDDQLDLLLKGNTGTSKVWFGGQAEPVDLEMAPSLNRAVATDLDGDQCVDITSVDGNVVLVQYARCAPQDAITQEQLSSVSSTDTQDASNSGLVPELPPTHTLKLGHQVEFHAYVGQDLRIQMLHPNPEFERFGAIGGPMWAEVSDSGVLSYKVTKYDVGKWQMTVHVWKPLGALEGYPLILHVHSSREQAENPEGGPRLRHRSRAYNNVRVLQNRMILAAGVSGGGSDARQSWAFLGTDWVLSSSPHLSVQLENPESGGVWWNVGAESAPWFFYLTENAPLRHYLSAISTIGWIFSDKFQAGVFGQAGFFITGLGARVRWMPVEHKRSQTLHGEEARITWFPSSAGFAGSATLLYSMRLPFGL